MNRLSHLHGALVSRDGQHCLGGLRHVGGYRPRSAENAPLIGCLPAGGRNPGFSVTFFGGIPVQGWLTWSPGWGGQAESWVGSLVMRLVPVWSTR